jgi:bla regulator protein blaR1
MIPHLAFMVTGAGTAVANHLWQSSVFGAAAWLTALQLRRNRAQVRHGIWLAASVKFLIPFSLLIDLGGLMRKPQRPPLSLQTTLSSAMSVVGQPFSGLPAHPMNAQSLPGHFTVLLPEVCAGVWVCGIVTVLLIWCMRWRKIYRALHRAVPVKSGREFELLRRLETLAKVRRHIPMLRSADMMEPGIFGIFHPLMLWPDRLSERLENEHIEGILAHELVHVRRHDNLTAAIHMLVEAVFWFHPMVWWIESRMLQERERACDEGSSAVSRQTGSLCRGLVEGVSILCRVAPDLCVGYYRRGPERSNYPHHDRSSCTENGPQQKATAWRSGIRIAGDSGCAWIVCEISYSYNDEHQFDKPVRKPRSKQGQRG